MTIWANEIKELDKLYESFKGHLPDLEKELEQLIKTTDANVVLLYSRRCLEVIITDLCECELNRPRKTEPLKGIIDKLNSEIKVPSHIITSMHGLNSFSTYGTHPKNFDPEQVKPVLNNLTTIIKWYLKYKESQIISKTKKDEEKYENSDQGYSTKETSKPKKRLILLFSGLLFGFVIIVLAVLYFTGRGKPTKDFKGIEKSVAVLPFKLLSNEPDKQYLADGVMDAILLHLQKFRDLRVISRTSVEQYRGTTKTTLVIGQELDVEYLLEGSFQKDGDNVRLIVQLIKAKEESHAWANDYNRNWKDIFSVQSEVAQTIAKELYAIITPEEKQQIEKVPTANLKAYDKYLIANDYQQEYTKTHNLTFYQKAVTLYKAALTIDSTFAKAYTGLASAYYTRYYWENYYKQNFLDSCLILVNKALDFDDQLDEAYYLKGKYYRQNGHFNEALTNFDTALKINPNYFQAYYDKGNLLTRVINDYVKGLDMAHKALNLIGGEERPTLLRAVGGIYLDVGFFDKAKKYYQEALDLDKDTALYCRALAIIDFSNENFEEALKLTEKAEKIDTTHLMDQFLFSVPSGHDEEAYLHAKKLVEYYKKTGELDLRNSFRVGYAFYKVGKYKEAENYLNQQIKYSEESIKLDRFDAQRKQSQLSLAFTYAFKGEKVKAYQYLEELNTLSFNTIWRISLIKNDPMGASINKEERFQKLLKNMETKYQAEHERVRKWLEEKGML